MGAEKNSQGRSLLMPVGQNRLSSHLLLQLIRKRRDENMSLLGISSTSLMDSSSSQSNDSSLLVLESKLRRLAVDLLCVFSDKWVFIAAVLQFCQIRALQNFRILCHIFIAFMNFKKSVRPVELSLKTINCANDPINC